MGEFLEAGKIVAVRGIRGEVKINVFCDSPEFLAESEVLWLGSEKKPYTIDRCFPQKGQLIVKFKDVDFPTAERLVGISAYIKKDEYKLDDGVFFVADLIGLSVKDADTGEVYGKIKDVIQTGARDVYVIKGDRELLIPAIPEVIISVDIAGGEMLIRPLEGLFDI